MNAISDIALNQLFTEARTHNAWLPKKVTDQTLHDIYELAKWGPTSANLSPMRILYLRDGQAREKLYPALAPGNVDKVKASPVTAVIALDEQFYTYALKLFPHAPKISEMFSKDKGLSDTTALRNSSLQGAYFILASRALGLDCGPMSGFDNKKLDEAYFGGTTWKSNFICNLGYGDKTKLFPRLPRLSFEEACKIV